MSGIRYSFGADEHVFAEIDEEMSLEAFFKGMAICKELEKRRLPGVSESVRRMRPIWSASIPDVIHPDKMMADLEGDRGAGRRRRDRTADAHCRDAGALQRSLDQRNGSAVPRAPSGSEQHGHRICRPHQRLQIASTTLSPRIPARRGSCPWSALSPAFPGSIRLSTIEADRGAEILAATHRHAEADHRSRRLLHGDLFGARRRRLSDARYYTGANLRSRSRARLSSRTSWPCSSPATW